MKRQNTQHKRAKFLSGNFTTKATHTANKNIFKKLHTISHQRAQAETTMQHHYTITKTSEIKETIANVVKDLEQLSLILSWWSIKLYSHFQKLAGSVLFVGWLVGWFWIGFGFSFDW